MKQANDLAETLQRWSLSTVNKAEVLDWLMTGQRVRGMLDCLDYGRAKAIYVEVWVPQPRLLVDRSQWLQNVLQKYKHALVSGQKPLIQMAPKPCGKLLYVW